MRVAAIVFFLLAARAVPSAAQAVRSETFTIEQPLSGVTNLEIVLDAQVRTIIATCGTGMVLPRLARWRRSAILNM